MFGFLALASDSREVIVRTRDSETYLGVSSGSLATFPTRSSFAKIRQKLTILRDIAELL